MARELICTFYQLKQFERYKKHLENIEAEVEIGDALISIRKDEFFEIFETISEFLLFMRMMERLAVEKDNIYELIKEF